MARHNKEMTTETKQMILRLKREGYAHRKIAEIIGRDHSTITKFLKRYDERNSVENKPKTGRKKLVTERGDRVILRSVKVNRRETLRDLTNIVNERLPRPVSTRTVRRRLKFHGYTRRRVRKTLTVSLKNRKNRVNWCRGKLAMSVQLYWKRVIFSDETQVVVGHDRRVHVWRKADEIWRPECVGLRGGPCVAVMFWGCITFDGVGTLTEIEGNMNTTKYLETLGDNVWPVIAKIFPNGGYIFQDDNAPCHASRRAVQWKRENELNCLNWPSQSPDLNIIENVWRTIKIKLQNSKCDILNKQILVREVKKIWVGLTPVYIQSLYNSISRRIRSVIVAKGHITKY